MKYEVHVDSQPDPTGGWTIDLRVELHFDDNPGFTAYDGTLHGKIMHVKMEAEVIEAIHKDGWAGWTVSYIDQLVRAELRFKYPQLFEPFGLFPTGEVPA